MKNTEAPAIRVQNLHKSFRSGKDVVLKGVSLDFPAGKLSYILGPSGVGKSVLLKHLLGLLKPDSGKIWVGNTEVTALPESELGKLRLKFGMLFQNSALFDDLTVFDNAAFPLYEHTTLSDAEIAERVKATLSLLGMEGGWDKYPNELSGGMRKRVGLARAIIREPSILLYDEPTTGLDPVTRNTVEDLIDRLKKELKLTSIVISHDIASALLLADQIAFLHKGEIVFWGTPREFRNSSHPAVQHFLDAESRVVRAFQN
ncbi:MAG: ATP-binding cassette domain-containing protein [Bdellovibrio sp.]|nr:ATP-binding cassette domain-containing protein [Bdellovibrio sp.]